MKDSVYNIVLVLWALWYMSVLAIWVWVGQSMGLFGHYTLIGWSKVGAAFLFSLAANFFFNPLFWAIAGSCIRAAQQEDRRSKLWFYPRLVGFVLVAGLCFSVYLNFKSDKGDQAENAPSFLKRTMAPQSVDRNIPVVSGIMFYGDPSALVDGQVMKKGETVNGYEVTEITEKYVLFRNEDGQTFEARVK